MELKDLKRSFAEITKNIGFESKFSGFVKETNEGLLKNPPSYCDSFI